MYSSISKNELKNAALLRQKKKQKRKQSTLFICVSNVFFGLTFTDPKTQLNVVYFNL